MIWFRRLARVLVLLGLVLFLVWSVTLGCLAWSLWGHAVQVRTWSQSPDAIDPEAVCVLVEDLHGDVASLRRQAGGLLRLASVLDGIPRVGPYLQAAPHVLEAMAGLSEAGVLLCAAFGPELADLEGSASLAEMASLLQQHRAALDQALLAAERAGWYSEQIEVMGFSPDRQSQIAQFKRAVTLFQDTLALTGEAPDLLGMNDPKTYLLLAQNEDELRPAGGFIGTVGQVVLDQGKIVDMDFLDSYRVDHPLQKPYPDAPAPLFRYMAAEVWLTRDANWSPDFPAAAQQVAYFYEYGTGQAVDGVVALDQQVMEWLMEGFGPITISGTSEMVTSANVRQFMRQSWNLGEGGESQKWHLNRKVFIGQFAEALMGRFLKDPGGVDWLALARGLYRSLESRHFVLVLENERAAAALRRSGWDGALQPSRGDYLLVVDANLGFNKANALIQTQLGYVLQLEASGGATAELLLTYEHGGTAVTNGCTHYLPPSGGEFAYEILTQRCYYNYLRLYVPAGSVLRSATSHPTPAEYLVTKRSADGKAQPLAEEFGRAVLAQFFVVEPGTTLTTRFFYDLPQVAWRDKQGWHYSLLIQKQVGSKGMPISLSIVLPPGGQLLSAWPAPQSITGERINFSFVLEQDVQLEMVYAYE